MTTTISWTKDQKKKLKDIVVAVAQAEQQRKDLGVSVKELCDEAKEKHGFDPKAIKKLAKEMNMNEIERMAQRQLEEEMDAGRAALGLLADLPLGEHAMERQRKQMAEAMS